VDFGRKLMASAKQIAWRKKFARMAKSGKFKKKKTSLTVLTEPFHACINELLR